MCNNVQTDFTFNLVGRLQRERASGLPVLLEVNNVWDGSLITCDPLLKQASWQQEPGSGQRRDKVDSGSFFWLTEHQPNNLHC